MSETLEAILARECEEHCYYVELEAGPVEILKAIIEDRDRGWRQATEALAGHMRAIKETNELRKRVKDLEEKQRLHDCVEACMVELETTDPCGALSAAKDAAAVEWAENWHAEFAEYREKYKGMSLEEMLKADGMAQTEDGEWFFVDGTAGACKPFLCPVDGTGVDNPNMGTRLTNWGEKVDLTEDQEKFAQAIAKELAEWQQKPAVACCGGFPCPTCGQWSDGGHCYSCGNGASSAVPTPATPSKPDVPASVGIFDAHSNTWVPAHGKETELGALLGQEWVFDGYFGKFFTGG